MLPSLRRRRIFPEGWSWWYAIAYALLMGCLVAMLVRMWVEKRQPDGVEVGLIDTEGVYLSDELGLALELPANWQTMATPSGLIFSGETGNNAYYTTITLQALEEHDTTLDQAFEDTYGDLERDPDVAMGIPTPVIVGGMPGLMFALQTTGYQTPRYKVGVLLDTGRHIVDVGYAAPVTIFAESFYVYVHALESMTLIR